MNFISEDIKLAVKRGAVWMDEYYPDWATDIDLSKLQMGDCSNCVIGQAVGDYWSVIERGAREDGIFLTEYEWSVEHGFQSPSYYNAETGMIDAMAEIRYYAQLETLWTEEVKKRLG